MIDLKAHFRFLIALFCALILAACGGGDGDGDSSDDSTDDDDVVVVEPIIESLTFDDEEIRIGWSHALDTGDDEDGGAVVSYTLYMATEQIEDDEDDTNDEDESDEEDLTLEDLEDRFDSLAGATSFQIEENPYPITGLTNDTTYFIVITATTEEGTSDPSDEVRATPRDYSSVVADSVMLNDTGYTECGDYAYDVDVDLDGVIDEDEGIDTINSGEHDNHLDCTAGTDDDGDTVPAIAAQDASIGRDFDFPGNGNGLAGFEFTKLDASGNVLDASATDWSCVQDEVTGLIWEVKTADEGLHDAADRYTWYNLDDLSNGGFEGYERAEDFSADEENDACYDYADGTASSYCNTSAFVDRVNAEGLCGANDWRMPTREELLSLIHFGLTNDDDAANPTHYPSVDTDYFPNTQVTVGVDTARYWSSAPYAASTSAAWAVYFGAGGSPALSKGEPNAIRLVRQP